MALSWRGVVETGPVSVSAAVVSENGVLSVMLPQVHSKLLRDAPHKPTIVRVLLGRVLFGYL